MATQTKQCAVEGCNRKRIARGYCAAHYQRLMDHGDVKASDPITKSRPAEKNNNWKGGVIQDGHGRVLVYCPTHPFPTWCGTHVYRYRLVAEKKLGRHLYPNEIVHHINGIKDDDRPENLQVMTQSEHASIHMYQRNYDKASLLRR